jgi:hypothetical protein
LSLGRCLADEAVVSQINDCLIAQGGPENSLKRQTHQGVKTDNIIIDNFQTLTGRLFVVLIFFDQNDAKYFGYCAGIIQRYIATLAKCIAGSLLSIFRSFNAIKVTKVGKDLYFQSQPHKTCNINSSSPSDTEFNSLGFW